MPPKLKEATVRGFCAKMKNPPKGVGGSIVQSLELKRNVTQTKRGNKVFERAIEERQTQPGVATTRVGTKIYYFDNDPSPLNAQMDSINLQLKWKCVEIDELDASLAENELKMAKLDAELEKLDIIGDEAIEDATITESEDLDLLLVPSIQNLIFRVYNESGIKLPPPGDGGRAEGELQAICKEFCKTEFDRLEREKKGANSPCIELSDASDAGARKTGCQGAPKTPSTHPPSVNKSKACPLAAPVCPLNRQNHDTPTRQQTRQRLPSHPTPTNRSMPQTCPLQVGKHSMQGGEHSSRAHTPTPRAHTPTPRAHTPTPRAHTPTPRAHTPTPRAHTPTPRAHTPTPRAHTPTPRAHTPTPRAHTPTPRTPTPTRRSHKEDRPAGCMDGCEKNFGNHPPQIRLPPQPCQSPPVLARPPVQRERTVIPAKQHAPPAAHTMSLDEHIAACIDDCQINFGKKPRERPDLATCFANCEILYGEKPKPPKPPPPPVPVAPEPPKRTLEDCIRECEQRFAMPVKPIIPRPPLFSRIINGKRCFPDLSEIPKNDQTLYMAERDAYVLFRRQFADRGNELTFYENPNEFEEYFFNYINGTSKINVPICPPTPKLPPKPLPKTPSEELVQSFVELQKIELDSVLQRNVLDLALDRPDRDPEVIALLMNERLPLFVDPLIMSELAVPYPLHKRLFATDVRHTAPGSIVPRTLPVQALNLMNTHVMEGVEAIIKSNEFVYPLDNIATTEIKDVEVIKPVRDANAPDEIPAENYRCVIELHPFRVETFFQLRGANVPLWYPGMFTAFPDGRSSIKLISTPSALINTAWRMCAP